MAIKESENIEIEIDLQVMAIRLSKNPEFIQAVSIAVRDQLSKDARKMGNLLGTWAQKQPTPVVNPPKAVNRLN